MPFSRTVGRLNRVTLNPVLRPLAARLPGMAVVEHRGRRSGTPYRTPVLLFRSGDTLVVALTYGSRTDWVRNVLASEGATIHTRGRTLRAGAPVVRRDDTGPVRLPAPVRAVLTRADVHEYLHLTVRAG
jgi:deazaflavin-dependent oxidoreductase (nitroreductase family)